MAEQPGAEEGSGTGQAARFRETEQAGTLHCRTAVRWRAAVLGSPISHSLSPALHTAAYAAFGLTDWEYTRFEVAEAQLASFLDAHLGAGEGEVRAGESAQAGESTRAVEPAQGDERRFIGFSLTMPLKYELVRLARQRGWTIDNTAALTGGGNTLVNAAGGVRICNTDVDGIVRALAPAAEPQHPAAGPGSVPNPGSAASADEQADAQSAAQPATRGVVIGSGATGASAVVALSRLGVSELTIYARNEAARRKLAELAAQLGVRTGHAPLGDTQLAGARYAVSTLPAGAVDAAAWTWPDSLTGTRILDAAYAPGSFSVGKHAGRLGAEFVPGSAMLVEQAVSQWILFAAAAGLDFAGQERSVASAMYAAQIRPSEKVSTRAQ